MKLALFCLLLCFSAWANPERVKYPGDITVKVTTADVYECVGADGKKLKAIIERAPDIGRNGVVQDWGLPVAVGKLKSNNEFVDILGSRMPEMLIEIAPNGSLDFAYTIPTTNGWNRYNIRCQLEQIEAYMDRREGKEINSPHSPQSRPAGSTTR
jgi:hypothetical protein